MTMPVSPNDFLKAEITTLNMALAQAQDRIKAQVEMARGADSRAQGLLAVSAAFTGLATTAGLSALNFNKPELIVPAAVAALVWLSGALISLWSLVPVAMHTVGWPPRNLVEDFRADRKHHQIVAEMIAFADEMIEENQAVLRTNAARTKWSMLCLVLAPVAAVIPVLILALYRAVA